MKRYQLPGVSAPARLAIAPEYPIQPKEHGPEFLLDHRHLWLRSRRQHAIMRVRSEVVRACREYFLERDAQDEFPESLNSNTQDGAGQGLERIVLARIGVLIQAKRVLQQTCR